MIRIQSYITLVGRASEMEKESGTRLPAHRGQVPCLSLASQCIIRTRAQPHKHSAKHKASTARSVFVNKLSQHPSDEAARLRGHFDEERVSRREMKPSDSLINTSYQDRHPHLMMNFPACSHTNNFQRAASGIQKLLTAEHLFKAFCAANEGWRNFN